MRIWLLPIEPIEERYSAQWSRWWPMELRKLGHEVEVVNGDRLARGINTGQFLDAYDTHYWKSTQVARMAKHLHERAVEEGDVVLLLDAWNPAVTSLAYMRAVGGPRFKLAGLFHAGTWDSHDHLTQRGMMRWARFIENGWCAALDAIFVATEYHGRLLRYACPEARGKMNVAGFPLYADEWQEYNRPWEERSRVVVFPHRLAPEKAPEEFAEMEMAYRMKYAGDPVLFVRTKDSCRTKAEYYQALGMARVAVSTAKQETWGIAMLEAASLGCWPVVPDQLAYPETFPNYTRYRTVEQAVEMIHNGLEARREALYGGTRWEGAIAEIARRLEMIEAAP